ncbi:MAG: MBL fold metallo-hydrolase [Anaerolineaceae bacterium]|nr:MBL fold metallo-hydrolase [Anaerolineaceae bacterium]
MELTWYGHSCFCISDRGLATVVCDPYDNKVVGYEPLKLKADIVTTSHKSPRHQYLKAVKGSPYVISGPGEFEIGGVFITGLRTDKHNKNNLGKSVNTLYLINYFGVTIVHLGDMMHVPTQTEVESLGPVHVALVPVGGGKDGSLNAAKASEVISLFEPNIVIPMHYATSASKGELEPISKFLKVMGLTSIETLPTLKISNPESLPDETQVIVLDYQH